MKLILSFGILLLVMSFCGGIGERLKNMAGNSNSANTPDTAKKNGGGEEVEVAILTPEQQTIRAAGKEMTWDEQGISWSLPQDWKKMEVRKESLNYSSPDNAFLIGTISVMPDNFPSDVSLTGTYDSSMQQLKNGKYQSARYLEIDGIKGVEFIEAVPEDKDGIRRHQWIAFRNYQGQNQQLNIMLTTSQTKWDKHTDEFPAVLYSMKIAK